MVPEWVRPAGTGRLAATGANAPVAGRAMSQPYGAIKILGRVAGRVPEITRTYTTTPHRCWTRNGASSASSTVHSKGTCTVESVAAHSQPGRSMYAAIIAWARRACRANLHASRRHAACWYP